MPEIGTPHTLISVAFRYPTLRTSVSDAVIQVDTISGLNDANYCRRGSSFEYNLGVLRNWDERGINCVVRKQRYAWMLEECIR